MGGQKIIKIRYHLLGTLERFFDFIPRFAQKNDAIVIKA
jgi:hypothetical protein